MATSPLTVRQIAEWVSGDVVGDEQAEIRDFAPFESAGPGELTFAVDDKRLALLSESQAGAVIVPADATVDATVTQIRVEHVEAAIAELLARFAPPEDLPPAGVHATAVVDPSATLATDTAVGPHVVIGPDTVIGERSQIGANVVIGREVTIGQDCLIFPGAVIATRTEVGHRVRIGPNSVIGSEGFGYVPVDGVHQRIEHIGNVVIEDDVDLGACTCVDRAKFGSTCIGRGAKIDNLVQIAHNVQVGEGSLLAGQVGVAGSTKLGRYVVLGGHAGIRDNITIGDGAQVAAFSAVSNHVPAGETFIGIPARPAGSFRRMLAAQMKLPEWIKRIKALEKKVDTSQ